MKTSSPTTSFVRPAFTLIELLVVIAVIAILASLLFTALPAVKRIQKISLARAERVQLETTIENYKIRRGTYPPDNPNNFLSNPLFFELKGTILTNLVGGSGYKTLDGSGEILTKDVSANFGVGGFVNSSASARGDDDKAAAENFLPDLKPKQSGAPDKNAPLIKILSCSVQVDEPANYPFPVVPGSEPAGLNPWRYISTHPTNNPNSYDLWVDLVIGGKTNRVSNWSNKQ